MHIHRLTISITTLALSLTLSACVSFSERSPNTVIWLEEEKEAQVAFSRNEEMTSIGMVVALEEIDAGEIQKNPALSTLLGGTTLWKSAKLYGMAQLSDFSALTLDSTTIQNQTEYDMALGSSLGADASEEGTFGLRGGSMIGVTFGELDTEYDRIVPKEKPLTFTINRYRVEGEYMRLWLGGQFGARVNPPFLPLDLEGGVASRLGGSFFTSYVTDDPHIDKGGLNLELGLFARVIAFDLLALEWHSGFDLIGSVTSDWGSEYNTFTARILLGR